jgi:hypothetical protein
MHKCEKVQKHPGCFFFVAQEVEKSNFYEVLERVMEL